MAQLSEDCFAHGGRPLRIADAQQILLARTGPVTLPETIPLRAAAGRFLAADLRAPADLPRHDNAAVDGYAVRHADLRTEGPTILRIGGRAAAGHPLGPPASPGEAIRIFTGAMMPLGTDTVVMQEDANLTEGGVNLPAGLKLGANRRRAGEDIRAGMVALPAGRRLRAPELGLAAALGLAEISVYRPLRIALLSTGDELREPGAALPEGAIYDANRYALAALLEGLGCHVTDLGIVLDDPVAIRENLEKAAAGHDLIVSSGGMSVGEEDHVKAAIEMLGAIHFWRLAIRPGRPVALGQIGRVPFLGLPGNPVAVMVTFLILGRPLILRLAGGTDLLPRFYPVRAGFDYAKKPNRREYLRARLRPDGQGGWTAERFPRDSSGIITSMTESEGLLMLAEDEIRLAEGETVPFLPFREILD